MIPTPEIQWSDGALRVIRGPLDRVQVQRRGRHRGAGADQTANAQRPAPRASQAGRSTPPICYGAWQIGGAGNNSTATSGGCVILDQQEAFSTYAESDEEAEERPRRGRPPLKVAAPRYRRPPALLCGDSPDDQARKFLSNLLVDLHGQVGSYVVTERGMVRFAATRPHTVDVVDFCARSAGCDLTNSLEDLETSVNVVQSRFPEKDQSEITGVSRSVSNLGSSLGVAIAGTVIVASLATANAGCALALIVLMVFAVIGLIAAIMLPVTATPPPTPEASPTA